MPFKLEAQKRFMYKKKPELARDFEKHTQKNKKLPERKNVFRSTRKKNKGGIR